MTKERVFRYNTAGRWFKGNTHVHSTASDGGFDFPALAERYHSAGYDFLCRTDHWVTSRAGGDGDGPLVWLDGIEIDGCDRMGAYFHVVCLGTLEGINPGDDFETALLSARRQGALTILAHPHWCGNTIRDCLRWHFDGVETYNHICHWLNGKGDGLVYWCAALEENPAALGLAADDAHLSPEHQGWNGGWVVVNAPERSPGAILAALRRGNFYSSRGPEIFALSIAGDRLRLETSPVRFARLVGPASAGDRTGKFNGPLITGASFPIPGDWGYAYVEIEDELGRLARTNSLFINGTDNA